MILNDKDLEREIVFKGVYNFSERLHSVKSLVCFRNANLNTTLLSLIEFHN